MTTRELTRADFSRMMPASVRRRLMAGEIESGEDVSSLRRFVNLSQAEFAEAMGISVHTLRNWEQGRRKPDGSAIGLLRIAARHPRIIRGNVKNKRGYASPPRLASRLADADPELTSSESSVPGADKVIFDGVNLAADAISIANPLAGLAIKTASVLCGWAWSRWKYERVQPVLHELTNHVRRWDTTYLKREDFADILEDALRRISEQPEASRRGALRNVLMKVIEHPQSHGRNRWFLRCADELDGDDLIVLNSLGELKDLPYTNPAMSWDRLVDTTKRTRFEVNEVLERLATEHLVAIEGSLGLLSKNQVPSPYRSRITTMGTDLLTYLRG